MLKSLNKPIKQLAILLFVSYSSMASAQTCDANAVATTPTSDFTVHSNGTVTHKPTGLMWQVCSEGQAWQASDGSCTGTATIHNWQQSLQIPATLNTSGFAGYTDWRLPNLKELKSIAELSCHGPAINEAIFNNTPSNRYWSSSPFADYSNIAWGVHFNGGVNGGINRDGSLLVRLVRSGQ